MDNKQLNGILVILVPQIIKEIVVNDGLNEIEATEEFYSSVVYEALENEKTKLWHLSPKAIYELYKEEKTDGVIYYPEEA